MSNWFKAQGLKLLSSLAPRLAIWLLTKIEPEQLAEKVRPYIVTMFKKAGPEWRKAFKAGWDTIDEIMDDLLDDSTNL